MKYTKITLVLLLIITFAVSACFSTMKKVKSESQPISHEILDALLKAHVDEGGWVDYKNFDKVQLQKYLDLLSANHPNDKHWSPKQQQAYWINAYNAFTIDIVLQHYPVASIKDIASGMNIPFINTTWDIKFIKIEGQEYDLNNIEHNILRKYFDDPRIHFGVNCASVSCPALPNYAFTADQLDEQLDALAKAFLADKSRNIISADAIQLSKIFSWFKGDFTKKGTLIEFLNQYSPTPINNNAKINYLDYDWQLNEQS